MLPSPAKKHTKEFVLKSSKEQYHTVVWKKNITFSLDENEKKNLL